MQGASFLLVINAVIGLTFATAFAFLAKDAQRRLALCCSFGFIAAAGVAIVEILAPWSLSERLTSSVSFGLLTLALTLIVNGIATYYLPQRGHKWLFAVFALSLIVYQLVIYQLKRDSLGHALGYQAGFAFLTAVGAGSLALSGRARALEWLLGVVLALSSLQFIIKGVLAHLITTGPTVQSYILTSYAQYSQMAGAILSLMLGLCLFSLLVREYVSHSVRSVQLDPLSGVMNRSLFYQEADKVLASGHAQLCLILCDLDHFKTVNDQYGHAGGDEVIAKFGQTLKGVVESAGLCGRIGGEEFAVLLSDCDVAGSRVFVQGVRAITLRHEYTLLPGERAVTARFGIACVEPGESLTSAMQRADRALYAAKNAVRDCVRVASHRAQIHSQPVPIR